MDRIHEEQNESHEGEHDLVWGAAAIGEVIGVPARRSFYLLEKRLIPGKKVGRIWVSGRKKLREHLLDAEEVA